MKQRVRLTWVTDDRFEYTEEVYLLDDDDEVSTDGKTPLEFITKEGFGRTVRDLAGDTVAFEDDDGIFFLEPRLIKKIEKLEETG